MAHLHTSNLNLSTLSPYPDCSLTYLPLEIPPVPCKEKRKTNWLYYLLGCLFCLLCVAFVTFLVLFILAVSGGLGPIRGRMISSSNLAATNLMNEQISKANQEFLKRFAKKFINTN